MGQVISNSLRYAVFECMCFCIKSCHTKFPEKTYRMGKLPMGLRE
jgi:hypothetical protein